MRRMWSLALVLGACSAMLFATTEIWSEPGRDERTRPGGPNTAGEEVGPSGETSFPAGSGFAAMLGDYLRRWESFGFSGAVLVAEGGQPLLEAGYGLADRAAEFPATADTLFDIGSVSKQFTATAILLLAEDGRLRLQDSIASVLEGVPEDKRPITMHHLLTHTSGVSDFGRDTARESRDELVAEWLAQPLAAAPGETYDYSNLGYSVLAAIVEIASGRSFDRFLHEELFEPAGMTSTALSWEGPERWAGKTVALGYGGFSDPCDGEDPRQRPDGWRLRGSGSVLSSVADLWRWEQALTGGRILDRKWLARLDRPYTTAEADFLSYGYGWRLQQTPRRTRLVWHSGLEGAFSSIYRRYVDEGVVLLFLSNRSFDGVPSRNLLVRPAREGALGALLFGGDVALPPRLPLDSPLPRPQGTWVGPNGSRWTFTSEDDGMRLQAENQAALDALFPPGDASAEEVSAAATRRARGAADALVMGDLEAARAAAGPVDPYGYSDRDLATALEEWRARASRLGPLRRVEVLGSTWVRRGPSERQVSHLRLHYERGTADEHILWYADDEVYLIPCAPESTSLRVRPLNAETLIGFDPVSGVSYTVSLDVAFPGGPALDVSAWGG